MICNARKSLAPGRREGLMPYVFKSGYITARLVRCGTERSLPSFSYLTDAVRP